MASDKQIAWITNMIHDKYGPSEAEQMVAIMPWESIDTRKASEIIDRLRSMPNIPKPGMPAVVAEASRKGENGSLGPCSSCGHPVAPRTGFYYGPFFDGGNKWKNHHKDGECPTEAPPAPVVVEEGFYKMVGGDIIKVYRTKNDRLAGKTLNTDTGKFEYTAGAASSVSSGGTRMTVEEAAAYGHRTGRCIVCAKELTDPESVERGIGPVCVSRL